MDRFHFHVHNSVIARDEEGIEMADLATATACATRSVRRLMSDEIRNAGCTSLSYFISIATSDGEQLRIVRYGDGVDIRP